MRDEHRRGMRDEGWGPSPRPGGPEWGPRRGRGPGRSRRRRSRRARVPRRRRVPGRARRPGWGGPGRRGPGGPGGRGWGRDGEGIAPVRCPGFPGPPVPGGHDGPFGPRGFGRGTRARKGDVRGAILDLFAEEEGRTWNGYQLIQEIPARTDGSWRPSAGSVYPALQQLEDEGLIAPQGAGRRRVFTLTDKGRAYVEAHADELRSSWDAAAGMTDDDAIEFRNLIRQVMMAVMEVRRAGSAEQVAQARAVLAQARKSLYLILADDEAGSGADADEADDSRDSAAQDTVPLNTEDDGE